MAVKEPTGGLKKACWKGYTAVGMKMKNGRKVPNCVPANEEREIPLSHRTKHDVSHYRVLNNGRDVSKHDSYEEAIAHAGEHRRRLKSKGYDADKISVHAYVKEEKENYGLPAHSMKHVMQKIKDGHWEVSSGEVKSGQHLSIIDHTKGKKRRMIHVKEESNEPKDREWGTTKLTKRYKKDTPGQCDCNTMKEESDQITEDAKRDRVSADLHKQGIGSHWRNPQVLVVHDKHKKKVEQYMDKITGGWVHVVGHSEEPMKEEAEKQTHLVKVTVSEPSLKSAEPMLKGVRVRATSEGEAIKRAKSHFRKAGYKVHDAYHHSTITTVKKAGQMDEAATSKNPHYGYHGTQEKDADKKYSAMHTRVKKVVGAAGHLGDVKKPNVVVRHYLDSVRGRHAAGRSDGYIARDFAKFKKTYKPEMHEEVSQMDERNDMWHPDPKVDSKMGGRAAAITQEKPTKKQMDLALLKRLAAAGKRIAAEELEQIDELKKSTMASYLPKAAASYGRDKQLIGRESPDGTVAKARPELKRSVKNRLAGIQRASQKLAKEEVEQISEGPQRDATRAKNKLKDAISGANYKRTGAPVPDAEPQHKTAQAHNKAIGRSLRKMEEGTRDLTAALAKKIEKKTGGKETAVRNKAGLLVTKKKSKDKFEEAFKLSPRNSLKYREHKHEYEREEQIKNRPSYQGYHTQIHVDGRHYKAGDRMGAGEKGAQDAGRHAANIAKKTGKKVSLHMIHHETGKTLAIADHEDGKWKYRNLSEAAPIQKQPKAGVEKLVSKMNPDTKAKTVSETRNIIREVIKKAVDKQETNKANGKTATGERAPKIQIDPVIDLGSKRGIGGT